MPVIICVTNISCEKKNEKVMAIDVLLTPSDEMNNQALDLSAAIKKNNPSTLQLDENHIPHITLLQCYVKESDLSEIEKSLEGLYDEVELKNLYASGLVYNKDAKESFSTIQIEPSEELRKIHEETIKRVKPFILKDGPESAFVPNPDGRAIDKFTLDYVPKFLENYSYGNFDPHISLGVAKKQFLDSLSENVFRPMTFKATSLGIYQLGDSGTAQKKLWTSK